MLLDTFSELFTEQLILAGTGSALETYLSQAPENVRFLGFLEKEALAKVLLEAKAVIVAPQWFEPFGMSIIEAFAAGKPVLSGNLGNMHNMFCDGNEGRLFVYDSAEDLRTVIRSLDAETLSVMGAAARETFERRYSPLANYEMIQEIYHAVRKG